MKGGLGVMAAFVAIYAATRLLFAYSDMPVFASEQAVCGNFAKGLLDGLPFPWHVYRYQTFGPGPMISGLFLVPLFLIGGPEFGDVMLLGAITAVVTFVVWIAVARRFVEGWGLIAFGLLFVFSVPFFSFFSTKSFGNHTEMLLFIGLELLILQRLVSTPDNAWLTAALGFVCGAGTMYSFEGVLSAGPILAVWIALGGGREKWVRAGLLAVSFLLGYWPALALNAATGDWYHSLFHGVYGEQFTFAQKAADLFGRRLPGLANFLDRPRNGLFFAAWVAGWIAFGVRYRKEMAGVAKAVLGRSGGLADPVPLVVFAYPLVWIAAYFAASWELRDELFMGKFYLVVLVPFLFLYIASIGSRRRSIAGFVVASVIAAAVATDAYYRYKIGAGFALVTGPERSIVYSAGKGWDPRILLRRITIHLGGRPPGGVAAELNALDPRFYTFADEIVGAAYGWQYANTKRCPDPGGLEYLVDPNDVIRAFARRTYSQSAGRDAFACRDVLQSIDAYWEGVGQGFAHAIDRTAGLCADWQRGAFGSHEPLATAFAELGERERSLVVRGIGWGKGRTHSEHGFDEVLCASRLLFERADGAADLEGEWIDGFGRGFSRHVLFALNYLSGDYVPNQLRTLGIELSGPDAVPSVQTGFLREIVRRGYRLDPVEGQPYSRIVFVGND